MIVSGLALTFGLAPLIVIPLHFPAISMIRDECFMLIEDIDTSSSSCDQGLLASSARRNMLSTTFQDLPEEIVLNILSHVASSPPSKSLRHQVPSASLFTSSDKESPLKRASNVCRAWRRIAFPVLFRYVRIDVDKLLQEEEEDEEGIHDKTFFKWAKIHELNGITNSIVLYARQCLTSTRDAKEMYIDRRNSGVGILSNWERCIVSNVYTSLFPRLLHALEPHRLLVAAPPRTFAQMLAYNIKMHDAWAFDIPYQALEVSLNTETRRKSQIRVDSHPPDPLQPEDHLLNIRKWDKVSYSGGSCLNAYGTCASPLLSLQTADTLSSSQRR